MAQTVKNLPAMRATWVQYPGWEDHLEEGTATTPVFLPGESPWTDRSLAGYSPWGRKESDKTERLRTHMYKINKPQAYIIQHREYNYCFLITLNEV